MPPRKKTAGRKKKIVHRGLTLVESVTKPGSYYISGHPGRSWKAWKQDARKSERIVPADEWAKKKGKFVDLAGFDTAKGWVSNARKIRGKAVARGKKSLAKRYGTYFAMTK